MSEQATEFSEIGDRVEVRTSGTSYEVLIGAGLLARLPALVAERCSAHRYALIADENVAQLYGGGVRESLEAAGLQAEIFTFPAGEAHKNRESWALLSDEMLASGFGRDGAVIALGGGVTGDLAGFVAGTYMRGVPLVQVPTSLLAMIDSSVGGKTGVDTPAGKNLIGAFLQPRFVLADPLVLRTLAPEQLRAGLAEAIKHGAIADGEYFDWISEALPQLLELDPDSLAHLIVRSVAIKADVVSRDEKEAGPRKMLNFGHTLGHAVEALSGFDLLHGEAIAIGMVLEAALGERLGVTVAGTRLRLEALLGRARLPTRLPAPMTMRDVITATRSDKKARRGRAEYVLIERIGAASSGPDAKWGWRVDEEEISRLAD